MSPVDAALTLDGWITLGAIVVALGLMVFEVLSPDILLLAALGLLAGLGILTLEEAMSGFADPTIVALGSLFVVAAGLRSTGVLQKAAELLFGGFETLRPVLVRLSVASGISSAFLNNTPIVAMGIPSVLSWVRERPISASKLLIPLSYASILGGVCTLIGTSTNLVADGLLRDHGFEGLGFFELGMVGLPLAVVGVAYLVLVAPKLLPERSDVESRRAAGVREEGLHVLEVGPESRAVGGTVQELRLNTPELALVRIIRTSGEVVQATPGRQLRAGDRLTFRGDRSAVEELLDRLGLDPIDVPTTQDVEGPFELREVVIPEGSVLDDERVGDVNFTGRYGAAVVGVLRHGVEMAENPEDVVLRPGDTLLLAASEVFTETFRSEKDFYLIGSEALEKDLPRVSLWRPTEAKAGLLILGLVVVLATTGVTHISLAALGGAVAMVAFRLVTPAEARRSVDWSVLIVIGAAIGLAKALETSGAADWIAHGVVALGEPLGTYGVLGAIVLVSMLFTMTITNNAAVALIFPIAIAAARSQALDPRAFAIAITVSASLAFATPLSYQTNLMVYGPGGYRFRDFVKVGMPLQLILGALVVVLVPILWPF